jgi:hypothetical protein
MHGIRPFLLICGALLIGAATTSALSTGPFLDDVRQAYPNYKIAWFYCRTGNGGVAMLELTGFRQKWRAIVERYAQQPPANFASDKSWRQSLTAIMATVEKAYAQTEAGQFKSCAKTLLAVRQELRTLRQRNNVKVFSDLVDDYGDTVDELSRQGRGLKNVTPAVLETFRRLSAAMKAAVDRVATDAPERLMAEIAFNEAVKANLSSIALLDRKLAKPSVEGIKGAIGSVRADYRLLFLRYG